MLPVQAVALGVAPVTHDQMETEEMKKRGREASIDETDVDLPQVRVSREDAKRRKRQGAQAEPAGAAHEHGRTHVSVSGVRDKPVCGRRV